MPYLMTHFTETPVYTEQVYFSLSRDGLHWEDIGEGPILTSGIGDCGARDPFIFYNQLEKRYTVIATDLNIMKDDDWDRAQFHGSLAMLVWKSEDLIHWEEPYLLEIPELSEMGAGCLWAPETIFDEGRQEYFVYWASMIEGKQRIFSGWTRDFREIREVKQLIEYHTHIIDTTMAYENGIFYRFSAVGPASMERCETVDTMNPVSLYPDGVPGTEGSEGPLIFYMEERKQWCLMVDTIIKGGGYIPVVSDTLEAPNFAPVPRDQYDMGYRKKRHGSVLPISEERYNALKTNKEDLV